MRTLSTLILLAACTGGDPEPSLSWSPVVEADARGAFLMAWGPSSDEVWVVGGQPEEGLVLRGDASGLTEVPLPADTPLLNWVHGTASDDVWVAGLHGTLLHWDGSAWDDQSLPTEAALWGVHAIARDQAWAVGGQSAWGGDGAVAAHYDGTTWTQLVLPIEVDGLGNLFKAFHDGTTLWACGYGGAVVRSSDGDSLVAVPSSFAGDIVTVHGRAGQDPLFVGGRGTGAVLELVDGKITRTVTAPAGLSGVHAFNDTHAIVVGENGFAGIYDRSTDLLDAAPTPTTDVLHGTFVDPDGTVWAVGGNLYTADDTFSGSIWTSPLPETE